MIDTSELGPRSAALGVLAVVLVLVAVHVLEAALPSAPPPEPPARPGPELPPQQKSPSPGRSCVIMPDGLRVCDPSGDGSELATAKEKGP